MVLFRFVRRPDAPPKNMQDLANGNELPRGVVSEDAGVIHIWNIISRDDLAWIGWMTPVSHSACCSIHCIGSIAKLKDHG